VKDIFYASSWAGKGFPVAIRGFYGVAYGVPMYLPPIVALVRMAAENDLTGIKVDNAECVIWLDGESIVYATRVPFMVYDLRDKLEQLLKAKMELIPPHFAPISMIMHNQVQVAEPEAGSEERHVTLVTDGQVTLREGVIAFCTRVEEALGSFFMFCRFADEPQEMVRSLQEVENKLLTSTNEFSNASFLDVLSRRKLRRKMKQEIGSILTMIASHSQVQDSIASNQKDFERQVAKDRLVSEIFTKLEWRGYLASGRIDREVALTIVENSRQEIQYSGITSVTLWSAVIGTVVGFILSFLAQHI
jgi:hypothetical protein